MALKQNGFLFELRYAANEFRNIWNFLYTYRWEIGAVLLVLVIILFAWRRREPY